MRYVSTYENKHGELLIFVWEQGANALLLHSDVEFTPYVVTPDDSGDLLLDPVEQQWLRCCWDAIKWRAP